MGEDALRTMGARIKQIDELTPEDLREVPVWELTHGGDETADYEFEGEGTIVARPEIQGPVDAENQLYAIRVEFEAANGTRFDGYVTVADGHDDDVGFLRPVIVTERGQVELLFGIEPPTREEMNEAYEQLGLGPDELFPLQLRSALPVLARRPSPLAFSGEERGEARVVERELDGFVSFRSLKDKEPQVHR